jgi:hypothetical protein
MDVPVISGDYLVLGTADEAAKICSMFQQLY